MTQDERIPVSVVAGTAGARKTALARSWLDRRPAGARWAVLVNAPGTAGLHSPLREGAAAFEGVAGCACCTGKVVARAALVKLLRRRPWSRLLVELGEQADPGAFLELLRAEPFARELRLEEVVAVIDAASFERALGGPAGELAAAQVAASDRVLLTGAAALSPDTLQALAARLRDWPPAGRRVALDPE